MAESPDAAELIAKVREEFPGLAFSDARLMNRGEDHFVFVLDGEWCSDFPVPKHTGPAFGTSCGSLRRWACELRYLSRGMSSFLGSETLAAIG
jgi:hypothetical protein